MQILVLCLSAAVLTAGVWAYLAWQSPKGESFARTDLIPSGRRIAYLVVMLLCLAGVGVALTLIYSSNTLRHNLKLLCLLAVLFAASSVDMRQHIIPNTLILVGLGVCVVFWLWELVIGFNLFLVQFVSGLIACGILIVFFLLCALLVKGGVGMGDVKLILVMCLLQGTSGVISSIFFSLCAAFVLSVGLLIARKKGRKETIPFAPSILVGTVASVILTGM